MMNFKKILVTALALTAMVVGFQNCAKNDAGFSPGNPMAGADGLSDGTDKSLPRPVPEVNSIVGEYDVISVSQQGCVDKSCTTDGLKFKSKQTLNINKDGSVNGKAACNAYGGKYEATLRPNEGTHLITFKALVSTLMACSYLSEEQTLFKALSGAYKISNTNAEYVDIYASFKTKEGQESMALRLRRQKFVEPIGTVLQGRFRAVSVSHEACKPTMKADAQRCIPLVQVFKSKQSLDFGKGVIGGLGACNRFSAKFSQSYDPKAHLNLLSISNIISTHAACTLIEEESALFQALSKVTHFMKSANGDKKLVLVFPGGNVIIEPESTVVY